MPKFTAAERAFVKCTVAALSIKRIPEQEIINEIHDKTGKSLTKTGLFYVKESIKREAFKWYESLRNSQYNYIFEFKERINEILWLQKKHYEIVESTNNLQAKQASLIELHKLSITLSNLFDVAPSIVNGLTIPASSQSDAATPATRNNIIL